MFAVALPMNTPTIEVVQTRGESQTAQFSSAILKDIFKDMRRASTSLDAGYTSTIAELQELQSECATPDWDGYGANPINPASYSLAQDFLESLPLGMSAPSAAVEPDGQVSLEWYQSPNHIVSISFDPNNQIHYASIIGARKASGSEPFIGNIPRVILELAQKTTA
ncbi:MAG: hypothetical protein Q9M14_06670 [Mariprofundaceae bacterium]|nr:hypothetical protein [Mariprofundaceae bacterium]